jgi:hypothetical protein
MSVQLPREVQKCVKAEIYRRADETSYLRMGRIENGLFMDSLLASEDVGGVLGQYMPAEKVRTYIKDGVLNRYSKDRRPLERDVDAAIRQVFGIDGLEIEYRRPVSLHRLESGELLVTARGTYTKWETAIRRMLEFMAGAPGLRDGDQATRKLLVLFSGGATVNRADRELLCRGLRLMGIEMAIYEECER